MHSPLLFDFNKNANIDSWTIVDDVVMGGSSMGSFGLNEEGKGVFSGSISLENNGGFSSVRYRFQAKDISHYKKVILKLKGDGKTYQFRIKDKLNHYYSYIISFNTSGEWEEIEIFFIDMYPSFRGRRLDQANFSSDTIEEIAFLIANKKKENFTLLIDEILLD